MSIEIYEFSQFRLDIVLRSLFYRNTLVPLAPKTFDILRLLVQRKGQLVSKDELIKEIWPDQFVGENNLTVRMSALRKALVRLGESRLIETISGSGYRFVGRVREMSHNEWPHSVRPFRSLAILPFSFEGGCRKFDYLADGIVENLIDALSRLPQLKVMARSTVFRYKGRDLHPQKVGEELGVGAVLIGRISQASNNFSLSAEIISTRDGSFIWGGKYELHPQKNHSLPEEIANELSKTLFVNLSRNEKNLLIKRHTDSSEAYNFYLKGRYFYHNKRSGKDIWKSLKYFKGAIHQDPHYALPYCGLTDCYSTLSFYGLFPPMKMMPKAGAAVLKALELDDLLAEAHTSLGNIKSYFEWDWDGAQREFERALELNPYDPYTYHAYASYLSKLGHLEEALQVLKKARELDPLSLRINAGIAKIYYLARRYDDAIKQCFETLEIDAAFAPATGVLGMTYLQKDAYKDAIREFKRLIAYAAGEYKFSNVKNKQSRKKIVFSESDPEVIALLAQAYALCGRPAEARAIVNGLINLTKARYVEPHAIALVYSALGDKDKAFEWLERAYDDRSPVLTYIKVWPKMDSLRSDPRYVKLITRMRLQP